MITFIYSFLTIRYLPKKCVSVGSLGSEICTQKQLVSPTTQNQNK